MSISKARSLLALVLISTAAVALPAHADLLVTSKGTGEILDYSNSTGAFTGVFASGLSNPLGLAKDAIGNVYVSTSSQLGDSIIRFDSTGNNATTFVGAGSGGLFGARYMDFGPDGNLYVASHGTSQILRYDGTTGAFINVFTPVTDPTGVAFGTNGNLYVGSDTQTTMTAFDGPHSDSPGSPIGSSVEGTTGWGITVGSDGNVYQADTVDNQISKYTGLQLTLSAFATDTSLNGPSSNKFGPDGNLYVTNVNDGSINRYDGTTGAFIDTFVAGGSGGLSSPYDLLFTPSSVATPEPGTLVLMASGILSLTATRRRRKRGV